MSGTKGVTKMADFGELEDQLIDVFSTGHRPDYAAARRLLEQGADINAEPLQQFPDEHGRNLLSDACRYQRWEGLDTGDLEAARSLPDTVRFFLNNGFDVHKQDDAFGAFCLRDLIFTYNEPEILEAAKLLLLAGARNIPLEEGTPLDAISSEGIFEFTEYNRKESLILEALYQIVRASEEKRPYLGIDTYSRCLGRTVSRVLAAGRHVDFSDMETPDGPCENCFTNRLYFQCEDRWLVLDGFADVWSDQGNIAEIAPETTDITERFMNIVGSRIKDFHFSYADYSYRDGYRAITKLVMDNGSSCTFSHFYDKRQEKSFLFYR